MTWIKVEIDEGRTSFRPGETVEGEVSWGPEREVEGAPVQDPEHVESAEVRLVWFTRGRGDRDADVAAHQELPEPQATDRRRFRLGLPAGPYSASGKLVAILWAVEVVLEPESRAARTGIVVSPTGREVPLHAELGPGAGGKGGFFIDLDRLERDREREGR